MSMFLCANENCMLACFRGCPAETTLTVYYWRLLSNGNLMGRSNCKFEGREGPSWSGGTYVVACGMCKVGSEGPTPPCPTTDTTLTHAHCCHNQQNAPPPSRPILHDTFPDKIDRGTTLGRSFRTRSVPTIFLLGPG